MYQSFLQCILHAVRRCRCYHSHCAAARQEAQLFPACVLTLARSAVAALITGAVFAQMHTIALFQVKLLLSTVLTLYASGHPLPAVAHLLKHSPACMQGSPIMHMLSHYRHGDPSQWCVLHCAGTRRG